MDIQWDDTFFEINTDIPLYICMLDLLEFAVGDEQLNINIIQFL